MKLLSILILTLLSVSAFSQMEIRDSRLAEKAERIANRIRAVESELSRRDQKIISIALADIQEALSYYGGGNGGTKTLICLSNGEYFEKFQLYNAVGDKRIGPFVEKEDCQSSINRTSNRGVTCVSNGEYFKKFQLTNVYSGVTMGKHAEEDSCVKSLESISPAGFTCVSDGEYFEKFKLTNIRTGNTLGNWVSESSCFEALKDLQ